MSHQYQHILLAVELHHEDETRVVEHATHLAQLYQAKLSVIHAVEHINSYGMAQAYPGVLDVEQELCKSAERSMEKILAGVHVPIEKKIIEMGSPKLVIMHQAKVLKADLIVIGSHGRHGVQLLLGSTANAVLHNAKCDVLAVRMKN